ncbi:hypothetical protein NXY25_26060 [Bacteroides thetaiotaomicron]|nr:hypothetical protein [Bacteroides thetaiotaomicron]
MQAEKSAFFICQTSVMPLLGGKGTGLPRIRVKAALRVGRLKENHPQPRSGIFFRQALTQKGNPGEGGL